MKTCSKCKAKKEETEFHKQTRNKDGLCNACKACHYARNKEYRLSNPDKTSAARKLYYETHKEQEKAQMKTYQSNLEFRKRENRKVSSDTTRSRFLKYKFGITIEQYDEMLANQNGVCAICDRPSSNGYRLAVDHSHTTNKNRELLCHKCNTSLGLLNEDINTLTKMIEYLKKHS